MFYEYIPSLIVLGLGWGFSRLLYGCWWGQCNSKKEKS